MGKPIRAVITSSPVYGTVTKPVPPPRRHNRDVRSREYLTEPEVERLIKAAGDNRNGHRDATMILVAFRHGLRVSELVALKWDAVDFDGARIYVNRRKNGSPSTHPLTGRELRAPSTAARPRTEIAIPVY
jgi:type 1 fimbriae regulatory protein FimB/type 1 fimbriae regulatory protein FimE